MNRLQRKRAKLYSSHDEKTSSQKFFELRRGTPNISQQKDRHHSKDMKFILVNGIPRLSDQKKSVQQNTSKGSL